MVWGHWKFAKRIKFQQVSQSTLISHLRSSTQYNEYDTTYYTGSLQDSSLILFFLLDYSIDL